MTLKRPFVFINSAMSADGKISSAERRQVRISGREDMERVDRLRAGSDAVMVGVGTVLADDPSLRVKSPKLREERVLMGQSENPLRVVADSLASTPHDAQVLGEGCIIAVTEAAQPDNIHLLSLRAEVLIFGKSSVDLPGLLEKLYEKGVRRLMVEGGGRLNWSLIEGSLVDEIYVYVGPTIIGGSAAPTLVDGEGFIKGYPKLERISVEGLGDGLLVRWRVEIPDK